MSQRQISCLSEHSLPVAIYFSFKLLRIHFCLSINFLLRSLVSHSLSNVSQSFCFVDLKLQSLKEMPG